MRKFIVIAILLLSGTVAGAQRVLIKNIYVDGRMYYSAELGKERQKDVQCFDMLNLGVSGAFSDFCDYNFRVQFAPKFPYYVSEFEDDREFEQNTHIFNIGVSLKFEYKNN